MNMVKTSFGNLIRSWPRDGGRTSIATFAADIRVPYLNAAMMRQRNSVSSDHWPRIVAAAKRRGLKGITLELLFEMQARSRRPKPRPNRRGAETREAAA
jgi:hypothetical protein